MQICISLLFKEDYGGGAVYVHVFKTYNMPIGWPTLKSTGELLANEGLYLSGFLKYKLKP